jgi:hypothetical protein
MSVFSHHLQSLLLLNSFYLNSVRKSLPQQKPDSSSSSPSEHEEEEEEKAERDEHDTPAKLQSTNVM